MKQKVALIGVFIVLGLLTMFFDGLFHTGFYAKPSMAMGHGAHGTLPGQEGFMEIHELYELPFKNPENSIERLEYTLVDGVKEFSMTVDEVMWEYADGKYVHAWAFNGQVPGPEIRVTEDDNVRIIVKNNLPVPTSVHWHGVHVPYRQDGVPGFSQYPIEPGQTFTYEWKAIPAGTRFYHAHGSNEMDSVTQVDMGMTGSLIILPKPVNKTNITYVTKEITETVEVPGVNGSNSTFETITKTITEEVVTIIKEEEKYDKEYVYVFDEWAVKEDGSNGALEGLVGGGGHAHGAHAGATGYNIFTVNGRTSPFIPPLQVAEGDRVLVRMINVGAEALHPMHLHGHSFKVIAIDGDPIPKDQQRTKDVMTLNPAERVDIEFIADNPGAWLFHCHQLHHAAGGMTLPFLYDGYEQCCQDV